MKIKTKRPKPIGLKWKWQKEFLLVRMAIYIVLISMVVTIYTAYAMSQEKIRQQDLKIKKQYDLLIKTILLQNETDRKLNEALEEIELLKKRPYLYRYQTWKDVWPYTIRS